MTRTELERLIHQETSTAYDKAVDRIVVEMSEEIKKQMNQISKNYTNKMMPMQNKIEYDDDDRKFFGGNKMNIEQKKYKNLFEMKSLSAGGFDNFGEFLKTIDSGRSDNRLIIKAPSGSNEGVPSEGGFLVPPEYTAQLLDTSLENEIVRPRATVWPMKGKTKSIPGVKISSHALSLFGGIVADWVDESGTTGITIPNLRMITLSAKKLMMLSKASHEIVADSALNWDQMLGTMLTKAVGWSLDDVFLNGHGAGQPLGVLNCPCLIEVAKETAQDAATIVYENVISMFSRMHPSCLSSAVWVCSITAIPQIMQLSFTIGLGGVPVPALQETSGKFTLLGKEVLFTEKLPILGQKGDILLCDFSQYAIGLREELRIEKSNDPGFLQDESTWRTVCRADGMGTWDTTLTLKDGSTTVSPFICLAERT